MSKNIIIQNNGVEVTYTGVKKIKTRKTEGGTLYWIPEGEQPTAVKTITANGTYTADDENLYAYSRAIVNVKGSPAESVTGRDSTDGNDYNITVDPETDELEKTKIPSGIVITNPPTKTTYTDGETIDYTGMVVKTVDANGNIMETVPSSAVVPEITEADSSKARAADDISPLPHLFYFGEGTSWKTNAYDYKTLIPCAITSFYDRQTQNGMVVVASKVYTKYEVYHGSFKISDGVSLYQVTHNGDSFYMYAEATQTYRFDPVYNEAAITDLQVLRATPVAWAMLYGNRATGDKMLLPIRVENAYGDDDWYAYQEITVT